MSSRNVVPVPTWIIVAMVGALGSSVACDRSPSAPAKGPLFDLRQGSTIPADIKIAFARVTVPAPPDPPTRDIYGIREDGSGLVNLTPEPGIDDEPAWSPDGSKLAFRSFRDGDPEIYVMNADGSGVTRLTFHQGLDGEPAWSPDGGRIAFRRSEFLGNFTGEPGHPAPGSQPAPSQIWIMNADGSNPAELSRVPYVRDGHPSWSPDGSSLVFERTNVYSSRVDLVVMGVSGAPVRDITPLDADPQPLEAGVIRALDVEPSWSPDGGRIVFRALRDSFAYDIWLVDPDGKNLTEVIELLGPQITPAWSPDGERIVFADFGPGDGLRVMNRDGTGLTALTTGTIDFWPTWRR
jgi:Tol biopolymer transport system component